MARLSTALVQHDIASLRDIEEALARQVLYGGDVVSNFLEQTTAPVDEAALTAVVAETLGLGAPHAGALPVATEAVRRAVPRDVAVRHDLFPIGVTDDVLRVAVSEPLTPDTLDDLTFSLGRSVEQCAALHVRIREALNRDYGVALDRRSTRGLARLEGRLDPSPSRYPSPLDEAPTLASLPRSPTMPPLGGSGDKLLFADEAFTPSVHEALTAPAPPVFERERREPTSPSWPPPSQAPLTQQSPARSGASEPPSRVEPAPTPAPATVEPAPTPAPATVEPAPTPAPATVEPAPTPAPAPIEPPRAPEPVDAVSEDALAPETQTDVATRRRAVGIGGRSLAEWSAHERRADGRTARPRHRGPYTAAQAEKDLLRAEERDDILHTLVDFAAQYFEYTALFAVVGDIAEGRDARGPGATRSEVAGIGVPLDLPSILSRARDHLAPELGHLSNAGLDAQLARDLKRDADGRVLAIPVAVRGRCVLILLGDDGDADVGLSAVGDVIAFAPLIATALESLIRRKKAAARQAAAATTDTSTGLARAAEQRRARAKLPSRDARASALATALEGPPVRSSRRGEPASRAVAAPPPKPRRETPHSAPTSVRQPQAPARSLGPAPAKPDPIDRSDEALDRGDPLRGSVRPVHSRRIAVSAKAPPKRHADSSTSAPTVVVDTEADAARFVDELLAGNRSAAEAIRRLGEPGIAALVTHFPGPLTAGVTPSTPPSEAGPIVAALVTIGAPAAPFIVARSADEDPVVRAWAIRVLGHIATVDAARAVARRTVDRDDRVRAAARDAGAHLLAHRVPRAALLDGVFALVRKRSETHEATLAVEAIAAWRLPETVPRLISMVNEPKETAASVRWALEIITRQSFGGTEPKWRAWWSQNQGRHRIEWLIDALMHDDQEMRRHAGEELMRVSKEYFGYSEDLPEEERSLAQRRYDHWWKSEGRARFSQLASAPT